MTSRFVGMPRCPSCGRHLVRRSHRTVVERWLSIAYVYPFRCQLCGRRFLAVRWGARYAASSRDRREFERVPVRLPAVVNSGRSRAQGTTADLSMEGCAIQVSGSFSVGDVVQVEISFTPDSSRVATTTAVVRSVTPQMVGLHFQWMSAEDRQRLRRVIRDLLPAAESDIEAWDALPRRANAVNFWITALILLFGVLTLVALMPGVSLCTWGITC